MRDPTLTVEAPRHLWYVLFLRDAWELDVLADVPRCQALPPVGAAIRPAVTADEVTLVGLWERNVQVPPVLVAESDHEILLELMAGVDRDLLRQWTHALLDQMVAIGSDLATSPAWVLRGELAEAGVDTVVVLPVQGEFLRRIDSTLLVALDLYRDIERLRRAL